MTARDQQIEAAIAFGRSDEWIKQNVGATAGEIASVRDGWVELLSTDPWFQGQQYHPKTRPTVRRGLERCGTRSGFMRHRNLSEPPCQPCKDADRAYQADRYQKRKRATRGRAA